MAHHPRALIIEARFYPDIADHLLDGAIRRLNQDGCMYERLDVPGVLEIPPALAMALSGARTGFDVFVLLGCVIRGETGHYDVVAGEANRAIMDLAVDRKLALGNGILTVDTHAQALERARFDGRDKGGHAAAAALALHDIRTRLSQ